MRTIKFRGKTRHGKWVYGSLIALEEYTIVGTSEDGILGTYSVDPETVGQFTSLFDKDRNEIYEGDIIKVGDERQKIEVRFVRGVFAFLWDGNLDDEFPTGAPTHEWAKVVGNIHDNPGLIGRARKR